MPTTEDSFVCDQCGEVHEGLPTDWGHKLPDEIHKMPYLEKYTRARYNTDLATLDESRYFLRGVLMLPLHDDPDGYFGWGVWVEVNKAGHDKYMTKFSSDASSEPRFDGLLANELPAYEGTLGLQLQIQLNTASQRPTFWLSKSTTHPLVHEQLQGISAARHHEILECCGYFDED